MRSGRARIPNSARIRKKLIGPNIDSRTRGTAWEGRLRRYCKDAGRLDPRLLINAYSWHRGGERFHKDATVRPNSNKINRRVNGEESQSKLRSRFLGVICDSKPQQLNSRRINN